MSDFRDTAAARALLRAAYLSGEPVDAGRVLDALDQAARTVDAREAVAAAEALRGAIRARVGGDAWLMDDAELIEALQAQGGDRS